MGRQTGAKLSSCTSKNPSMTQFYLTGGILTATLTCARSFFLILNLTSSKYSKRSLLRTENTYSSRSLNSWLLQRAITLSMKGLDPLSSIISSFSPIDTSNSSIDPGNRVDFPNIMLVRFIYTKYLVSVSSVESYSFSGSDFSGLSAGGASYTERFSTIFSTSFCSTSVLAVSARGYFMFILERREEERAQAMAGSHSLWQKSNILKFSIQQPDLKLGLG